MKEVIVVYDDTIKPEREIRTITGDKSYGETILKRVTMKERVRGLVLKNERVAGFYLLREDTELKALRQELAKQKSSGVSVLWLYSNFAIRDEKQFQSLIKKAAYVNELFLAECDGKPAAVLLPCARECAERLKELIDRNVQADVIDEDVFGDLSDLQQFLAYITSGFDARFFNSLEGNAHTVTKKSNKIDKIKSEYNFYYLLPDDMKMWFVMPFDYREEQGQASYTMERFHMTDIAVRFVHGAVDASELSEILDKLFYFIEHRKKKAVSAEQARKAADSLYLKKLDARMELLVKGGRYEELESLVRIGTQFDSLSEVVGLYKTLYEKVMKKYPQKESCLVIGHGDLCFSNILYSREADLLKLIDPKGALDKEELYTDVYYDLAKLSHSVCGGYDFFNSGLYQLSMDRDMKWQLSIDADLEPYRQIFKQKLEEKGFSYEKTRLLEAGLFLSMLPYHMDQPGKVFGFILNAIEILREVEACTAI